MSTEQRTRRHGCARGFPVRSLAVIVCGVGVASMAAAGDLEPGQTVGPVELATLDGHALPMDNYAERPATVLVFLSPFSAVTDGAIEPINALHEKFRLRDVLFVGMCPGEVDDAARLRTYFQRHGVIFPIYRDTTGSAARVVGARSEAEAFLIDRRARLVYRGDGRDDAGRSRLESAIRDLLAGRTPEQAAVKVEGSPLAARIETGSIDDPYGAPAFSSELVFERIAGAPAHHCSTIAESPAGDLLCLWYGGSYESADDQVLFMSRRASGSRRWSAPEVTVRNPGQPPGNAVIFVDGLERVWIVWGRMESTRPIRRGGGWDRCRLMYRVSRDDGRTWSDDALLDESLWCLPRNLPITLVTGELLLPLSGRAAEESGSFFLKTADHGATWQRSAFFGGGSQPTIIERRDGSLLALMRHSGNIMQSESSDGGRSWSKAAATPLANPGAGIAMTRLENGHVVLALNDSKRRRTPLSVVLSIDEGRSWQESVHLETNPGEYAYPCILQASDGRIHVTYTFRRYAIMHAEFNEDWLVHMQRPN